MDKSLACRMFERIEQLLPNLSAIQDRESFFAPPPVAGDLASTANALRSGDHVFTLELIQDQVGRGSRATEQPWLTFRVDFERREAALTSYVFGSDVWARPCSAAGQAADAVARMRQRDVFATNWLANMLYRGVAFETSIQAEGAVA